MNTTNPTLTTPGMEPSLSERLRHSKALIPTLAVLAVTVAALGATLMVKTTGAQSGVPAQPALAQPAAQPVAQAAPKPVVRQAAAVQPQKAPVVVASKAPAVCGYCGVVESVVAVKRQEPVQGIAGTQITPGAVAGGVIGGLLGNQVGHGNGRAAATVLGAAGGAYAGNAIQKNMNTYTAYEVRVRMNDGSMRTLEQRGAIAAGSRVVIEGGVAKPAPVATSQG